MKPDQIEKANELLSEVNHLKKYKSLLNDTTHGTTAHFEFVQHYGELNDYHKVKIPRRHNNIFFNALDKIILELEKEIDSL